MAVAVLGIAIAMVSGKAAPLVDLIKAVDDTSKSGRKQKKYSLALTATVAVMLARAYV